MWEDVTTKKTPHEAISTRTGMGIDHLTTRKARELKRTPIRPEEDSRTNLNTVEAYNRPSQVWTH
jgi:hypothetical protein